MSNSIKVYCLMVFGLFIVQAQSLLAATLRYPATTIKGMIKQTFYVNDSNLNMKSLLESISLTNDMTFDYIKKNNSILGIKNNDIEKASIDIRNNIISLTNAIKITRPITTEEGWTKETKNQIIKNLDEIKDLVLNKGIFIKKTLEKKFPPLLNSSKELLVILKELTEAVIFFIEKLKNTIQTS